MYTSHFGLKKRPFVLSPDPEFLYMSRGHDLAFTHLEYGLAHNAGFVALTGEVGTGKTTLLNYLLSRADGSLDIAMLFNSHLDPHSLLHALAREFEVSPASGRRSELFNALNEHFLARYARGRRCVIVIDEAQNLSLRAFEELRMLSNLDAGSDFLVQIVLVGQPQLRVRLIDPALAQLTQRISVHYHLSAMQPDEIGTYIAHRLEVAGHGGPEPLFSAEALSLIARISKGVPRIINRICDTSLTYTFADGLEQVSGETVEKVIEDDALLTAALGGSDRAGPDPSLPQGANAACEEYSNALAAQEEQRTLLARMEQRLSELETRVSGLSFAEHNGTAAILLTMLSEERERTNQYSKKSAELLSRCKALQAELDTLKAAEKGQRRKEGADERSWTPSRGFWRVFSGSR